MVLVRTAMPCTCCYGRASRGPPAACGCRKPVPPGRMLCWPPVTRARVRHMRVADRHPRAPSCGGTGTSSAAGGRARAGPVAGATACPGERVVGLPPHPRRVGRARHHRGAVHGLADPQERRHRSRAPPGGTWLGPVPAVPGTGDPGAGLLHRRPAQRNEGLRACRD